MKKELAAVNANPLATSALSRLLAKTKYPTYFPYAADPQYPWIAQAIGEDLVKLLNDSAFSILPTEIDQFKASELISYNSSDRRSAYLSTKTYESGLTKQGTAQLTLTGDSTYRGDTIVDGGGAGDRQGRLDYLGFDCQ